MFDKILLFVEINPQTIKELISLSIIDVLKSKKVGKVIFF